MELDTAQALALLKRIAKRDEGAFVQVYKAVSLRVYGFAMHCLGDASRASEVVSETLYEVWRRPDAFRGESKFSTWLLGIARHKVIDKLRTRDPIHENVDELGDEMAGHWLDGFETIALQQRRHGVMHCIEKVGWPQSECLYFAYYEGLSLAEISAVQAVPENTVRSRLFHARTKIKKCLRSLLESEGIQGKEGVHP